ncbi:MAG TPA: SDR family NAD(P)-dependent oxidoreductase [Bryobacteraceae bacterium]|jgi:NAD(P)-dependent dehydrogenase (short-subunit alcohol dehydrogenase family)
MKTSTGRTVVVTGGAYGIGRAIARRFAAGGDAVIIADLDRKRGPALEKELLGNGSSAAFYDVDLRDPASVEDLISFAVRRWGSIDVLCNNAGVEINRRADEFTQGDWNAMVDVNLRAAFLASKLAFPYLKERGGSIVNIASVQGLACETHTAIYTASKAGLLGLTRGMAVDFARDGVRVNAICPGAIHTGMMEKYLQTQADGEGVLKALGAKIPIGRIGKSEEVAAVAYFLASAEASYVTGAHFVVDGGLLAHLAT